MTKKITKILLAISFAVVNLQVVQAQTNKSESVNRLVDLTAKSHPALTEAKMAKESVDMNKYAEEERRDYASFLSDAIKENTELTAAQKAFATSNMSKLVDRVALEVSQIQERNNNTQIWVRESLQKNYTAKLSVQELNKLVDYFASDKGKKTLNYISTSPLQQSGENFNYEPEDMLAYDAFVVKTALGKKFFKIFVMDAEKDLTAKSLAGIAKARAETAKLYQSTALNKLINEFVSINYKK